MLFDEEFINLIADRPLDSCQDIAKKALDKVEKKIYNQSYSREEQDIYLECFSLILSIIDNFNLTFEVKNPNLIGNGREDCNSMNLFFEGIITEVNEKNIVFRLDAMKGKFDNTLNQGFIYEFTESDINRLQVLINELRDHISSSALFDDSHKERLLKRLEKLQSEIHKRMSDIDRFWGLVGDAGVVIGKFGKDSKPIVDRIKEIANIAWRTQSKAEELPSDTPSPLQVGSKNVLADTQ